MQVHPIFKQLFVASSPLLASLSVGGAVSYPTVLLHQLKRNDTAITLDFDTASWMGAIHGFAGMPSILIPWLMQWRGRKFCQILACLTSIIGWVLAYTASSAGVLLVSESLHGFGSSSILTVACMSITEMTAPSLRDPLIKAYVLLQLSTMGLTCLITHYLHWRTISVIMGAPLVIALAIACFWPESPYWLAYKGRFEKCEHEFVWLRGSDDKADRELRELIAVQKENHMDDKLKNCHTVKHFINNIRRRDFYVPAIHVFVLQYLVYGMGCIVMSVYSIELFQRATGDENISFYGGFVLSLIQIAGISITMITGRYFKKKTIFLTSTFFASLFVICASLTYFLQTSGVLHRDSLICLYFIIAYLASISLGITPVGFCIAAELMPVKHRGLGGIFYIIDACVLHTVVLKFTPYILLWIDVHGLFMIFAVNGLICGLIIWKFVPDTQDKTLQQIENYYALGKDGRKSLPQNSWDTLLQGSE